MQATLVCFSCKKLVPLGSQVGFKECCPSCDADLHSCKNCSFYDLNSYNNCKESQAERVVDKDRANFCDYFRPGNSSGTANNSAEIKKSIKSSLDDLFKK